MGEKRADYIPKDLKKVENLNVRLSTKDYRVFKITGTKKKGNLVPCCKGADIEIYQ